MDQYSENRLTSVLTSEFVMAKIAFTATRVNGLRCPPEKPQTFIWDTAAPGLGLRVTPKGEPAFIFQGEMAGRTLRITIGKPSAWSIPQAQGKARELQRLIDQGIDPRIHRADQERHVNAQAITVGEAWNQYVQERTPYWGERTRYDHKRIASAGGEYQPRGTKNGITQQGPLFGLFKHRLCDLTPEIVEKWAAIQGEERPTYGRLAWRYFKVFLGWCEREPNYLSVIDTKISKSRRARDAFGKPKVREDSLDRNQLSAWFKGIRAIPNPVPAAYLQVLLLTGGRPSEILGMKWTDVDIRWRRISLRDKVEGDRVVPLTPYVEQLLSALPHRNAFVFSSLESKTGTIWLPHAIHTNACETQGIHGLTLHGLRRSFATLSEWLEIPTGVVAQIQGHKPSATAEKHYKRRPIDMLRIHHERFESWILEQAGVKEGESRLVHESGSDAN